jgi:1-acyl-sn-glycerol-3-phosphate acyltransferase
VIWIRSAAFVGVFYLWTALVALAMLPTLVGPRPWLIACLRIWSRGIIVSLRVICGVRTELRGAEHIPKGAALVASKHQCMFDTFVPFFFLPDCCVVLKKELSVIPFFGWYAVRGGMIVVDREAHAQALRTLLKEARVRLAEPRQLLIFPEGTRTAPGAPPDYKPGVAALYRDLELPCVPVAVNSGVHWPKHGFIRRPGTIVFEFLEPIPPGLKRADFMRTLEQRIETASDALLAEGI